MSFQSVAVDNQNEYISFPKSTEDGQQYISTWCKSFDQLENADSDLQLIADVLGTGYDPKKDYALYIIDRGEHLDQFGETTITPTWENMKVVSPPYVSDLHSLETIESVLNPEFQNIYANHMAEYRKGGKGEFDPLSVQIYAEGLPKDEGKLFSARHDIRTALGANSEFTGDGLTQTREPSRKHGVVEALCIERDPLPVSEMKNLTSIIFPTRTTT